MAINFPSTPSVNDKYTLGNQTWNYDGTGWALYPTTTSITNANNILGGSSGSLPYQTAGNTTGMLSIGTTNQVLTVSGGAPAWTSNPTFTRITANTTQEKRSNAAISTNTLTIDLSLGSVFDVTMNANVNTFTISNASAGTDTQSFTMMLTGDGTARTFTWGSNVTWAANTAPTITSTNGKVSVLEFVTKTQSNTAWYGFTSGLNF